MKQMKMPADDPRITAYALGELDSLGRAEVEGMIRDDTEAQDALAETYETVRRVRSALSAEDAVEQVGISIANLPKKENSARDHFPRKVVRFPYVWTGCLTAAALAMVFTINRNAHKGVSREREVGIAYEKADRLLPEDSVSGQKTISLRGVADTGDGMQVFLAKNAEEFAASAVVSNSGGSGGLVSSETSNTTARNPLVSEGIVLNSGTRGVESLAKPPENDFFNVLTSPFSTFSIDVDSSSYTNVRRFLESGLRPPRDTVRIEGLINYFRYRYLAPQDANSPFGATTEIAAAPWNPAHRLVRIGLKARETEDSEALPPNRPAPAIAEDVSLHVVFNPSQAQAYRLIGYENRVERRQQIGRDDTATRHVGAGQSLTALYEVVPVGSTSPQVPTTISPAFETTERAKTEVGRASDLKNTELFTLEIRYKAPSLEIRRKLEIPVIDSGAVFEAASKDFKFTAAVASLGMLLRESTYRGAADYDKVLAWAEDGKGEDTDGRRGEFIELVKKARTLSAE